MAQENLYERLKATCPDDWETYIRHEFVRRLGDATLPEAAFRYYLGQDYLFLIQFARAYALAAYKSDDLGDLRLAADGLKAILDVEMGLHVKYCAGWGLGEDDMAALPADTACLAYTSFVLERGMAGDLLDLHVALAPCMLGYAEIGAGLVSDAATVGDGNPYGEWIDMYAGDEYQEVAKAEIELLDSLMTRRGGAGRFASLADTFATATRLEIEFWQMGLDSA